MTMILTSQTDRVALRRDTSSGILHRTCIHAEPLTVGGAL